MFFDTMTVLLLLAAFGMLVGILYWTLRSVGLQEAGDPQESDPEELTEFEKRHTHRSDVHA